MSERRVEVEVGIPVRAVSHVQVHPRRDADGRPWLLMTMAQDGGRFFVCVLDVATGEMTQHFSPIAGASGAVGAFSPREDRLYLSANGAGRLVRFDPTSGDFDDLGVIDDQPYLQNAAQVDIAADGRVYIGTHDKAKLVRFNPATGSFTRFGRASEEDHYAYPRCGEDGTVAALVQMCFPHVVAWDAASDAWTPVGPRADRDREPERHVILTRATDGLLYIDSSEGRWRLEGLTLTPVETIPDDPRRAKTGGWGGPAAFPDTGLTWSFPGGVAGGYREIEVADAWADDAAPRRIKLDWEGEGTAIYKIHLGPDRLIYGSSILPEHIFRCDRHGDGLVDLGVCSRSTGEAYTMGNLDGRLYIASYPHARLSEYDPARPWRFGEAEGDNPRDLGSVHPGVANRPVAMVAGPAGKVWVGSAPDYGQWGGTLSWFDPVARTFGSHRHLTRDCSVVSLTWLADQNLLLAGTTIWPGSGATPRAYSGDFVLWDPVRDEKVWQDAFGLEPIDGVYDLFWREADGWVYGVVFLSDSLDQSGPGGARPVHVEVVRLDMRERRLVERAPLDPALGRPLEWALQPGPDGAVWGVTGRAVYRIKPGAVEVEEVWRPAQGAIQVAGPIVDGRFWYSDGCVLKWVDLG